MNERDKLIEKLIAEKGGSRKDYLNLLTSIAYHESAHTFDPKIKQQGGGPGRGKYQFEIGKHKGGITAAKRTKKYYEDNKEPVPKWLANASKGNDLDVSNLTSQQQDILFLGNMRNHPRADFSEIWEGKKSVPEFWADYHWAGSIKDRNKKLKRFEESQDKFKKLNKQRTPVPVDASLQGAPNPMEYILSQGKRLSGGGMLPRSAYVGVTNSFDEGGLHETNPHGGIPQGIGSNGLMNTVEQGEVSFNFDDGKYIFSNRLS